MGEKKDKDVEGGWGKINIRMKKEDGGKER
jgi:hypothetical protein